MPHKSKPEFHTTVKGLWYKLLLETEGNISHDEAIDYTGSVCHESLRYYLTGFRKLHPGVAVNAYAGGWTVERGGN